MLQVLTESDINEDGRKRVVAILEEQRLTLKFAMSRPQVSWENSEINRNCRILSSNNTPCEMPSC